MQAINCKMKEEMMSDTTMDSTNKVGVFMQQMIPHHANAVNMARILLTQVDAATIESAIEEGGLTDLLNDIINVQNFQIHQFRNYLGSVGYFPVRAPLPLLPMSKLLPMCILAGCQSDIFRGC